MISSIEDKIIRKLHSCFYKRQNRRRDKHGKTSTVPFNKMSLNNPCQSLSVILFFSSASVQTSDDLWKACPTG